MAVPLSLSYPRLHSSVVRRPPFNLSIHSRPDLFSKIVHPYNISAFESFLDKHNLVGVYPDLIRNLQEGFPIGPMPPLANTHILKNHSSVHFHASFIDDYLTDEVSSGRMDGPFPKEEIERILRGPFQSSPLIVAVQSQAPGEPDKLRVCRNLSKSGHSIMSVNSFIKTIHFPTRFDTAVRVAEVVSIHPPLSWVQYPIFQWQFSVLLCPELCMVRLAQFYPFCQFILCALAGASFLMLYRRQLSINFTRIFSQSIYPFSVSQSSDAHSLFSDCARSSRHSSLHR